ncbi:MAG: PadR family transcriptional regulator [Patescibacteria group bacterium]|nr:PadR family transcriptional regulator [Patescibacteria group bacterium]
MRTPFHYLKFSSDGLLAFMIVKIISRRAHSVYEIQDALKQEGFIVSTGSIYPIMSALRKAGHARCGFEDGDASPAIKTYELTERGIGLLSGYRSDWKRLTGAVAGLGK